MELEIEHAQIDLRADKLNYRGNMQAYDKRAYETSSTNKGSAQPLAE